MFIHKIHVMISWLISFYWFQLKKQEAKLKGELNELKIEEATAFEKLQKNKTEYNRLRDQEEEFLKEYCRYKRQINEIEDYGVT